MKENDDKYKNVSSKLSKYAIERLTCIANKKHMSIYQLIQMVCDTIIRYMDDRHNLSEEIERAMAIFEHMTGWADALNLADPTVSKEVAEAVYIFQDAEAKKRGFRAVKIEKPFCGVWNQTENVMEIFERLFNILMPELYLKLFRAKVVLDCNSVTEVINMLCDAAVLEQMNHQYREEFEEAGRRAVNGKDVVYGARTIRKKHWDPDNIPEAPPRPRQQTITFDADDEYLQEGEVNND